MLFECLLICIVALCLTFKLHKGHFKTFIGYGFLWVSVSVEIIARLLIKTSLKMYIFNFTIVLQSIIYISLLIFICKNMKIFKTSVIILLGVLLNAAVIFANGGFMPVDPKMGIECGAHHIVKQLMNDNIFGHSLISQQAMLSFLGDCISIRFTYPFPTSVSFGDIIIDIGLLILTIELIVYAKKDVEA